MLMLQVQGFFLGCGSLTIQQIRPRQNWRNTGRKGGAFVKSQIGTTRPHWLLDDPNGCPFNGLARIIIKKDLGKVLFWDVHFNVDVVQPMLQQKHLCNLDELRSIHPGSCVRFSGNKCITRSGEHSINVIEAQLEEPCRRTLPEWTH